MDLHLYDTATGEVRPLELRDPGKLSFYACGPTVYDLPHLGHGRMALTYDVLRRYVESRGVEVRHVSNVTDIEDKIINRARERGVSPDVITAQYEQAWYDAVDRLGVLRPNEDPHATAYVDRMIEMIGDLIERGFAYETHDSVYFSSQKVDGYGLLAKQSINSLMAGARVEQDVDKHSPIDFALWKKVSSDEPHWTSPWGPGRPGWHTECVVMSLDLLGDGFDLHTGGQDLMFPHHENERAQAIALGKRFANHWMHNGFVEMAGEKMSKSLGNFTTLTDLLDRTDARAYRMLVLRSHYRSPIEVTPETIADAEAAVARLDDFVRRFARDVGVGPTGSTGPTGDDSPTGGAIDVALLERFHGYMDDDLDTPRAIAEVFDLVREANTDADSGRLEQATRKAAAVVAMCAAVGLQLGAKDVIDAETADLIRQRDEARSAKDWPRADALRSHLQQLGWMVEDTSQGTQVHR